MSIVVFTVAGSSPFTLTGSIIYGTESSAKRLNQFKLSLSDGSDIVYDGGPTIKECILRMKGVDYDNGLGFETFLEDVLVFEKNTFSVSAVTGVNLGAGVNTAITNARYTGGKSSKGVCQPVAPGTFNISFPYKFKK
jgi:hypothetical protein